MRNLVRKIKIIIKSDYLYMTDFSFKSFNFISTLNLSRLFHIKYSFYLQFLLNVFIARIPESTNHICILQSSIKLAFHYCLFIGFKLPILFYLFFFLTAYPKYTCPFLELPLFFPLLLLLPFRSKSSVICELILIELSIFSIFSIFFSLSIERNELITF